MLGAQVDAAAAAAATLSVAAFTRTLDLQDAFSTCMLPLSMMPYPLRMSVRAVRGVRPEVTSVRLEHGEEVVTVTPLDAPSKMTVMVPLFCFLLHDTWGW